MFESDFLTLELHGTLEQPPKRVLKEVTGLHSTCTLWVALFYITAVSVVLADTRGRQTQTRR